MLQQPGQRERGKPQTSTDSPPRPPKLKNKVWRIPWAVLLYALMVTNKSGKTDQRTAHPIVKLFPDKRSRSPGSRLLNRMGNAFHSLSEW